MVNHQRYIDEIAEDIAAGRRSPPTNEEIIAYTEALPDVSDLTITEAATLIGLEPTTVRYYEDEGLLRIPRGGNGHRRFDRGTLDDLLFVHRMRLSGLSVRNIAVLRSLLADDTPDARQEARDLLIEHAGKVRRQIAQLQISLAITEHKIEHLTAPIAESSAVEPIRAEATNHPDEPDAALEAGAQP